jgi:hypothetical protein
MLSVDCCLLTDNRNPTTATALPALDPVQHAEGKRKRQQRSFFISGIQPVQIQREGLDDLDKRLNADRNMDMPTANISFLWPHFCLAVLIKTQTTTRMLPFK